jgi:endonuclease/exonuclease/phosphatase family metal-dependent hydrolase
MMLNACNPFGTRISSSDVIHLSAEEIINHESVDTLKVMTWNIKFGGARIDFFFDCFGDRAIMSEAEVIQNLEGIAAYIQHLNPDILFIQEIDLNSKRSAHLNQVKWILNHTPLNHAVYAPQWKGSYIPSHKLGRMNSGLAILSKYPLTNAKRIALTAIKNQNPVVRYFYLKRCILTAQTTIGETTINLLTTHTEAYAQDGTKKLQLQQIKQQMDSLSGSGLMLIAGGDFNAIPPHTVKVKGFPDSVCQGDYLPDDFSAETLWMMPFYNDFHAAITLKDYQKNNSPYFTHSVDKNSFWNRKLDYLFCNQPFIVGSGITHQSDAVGNYTPMMVSDHCPITGQIIIKNAKNDISSTKPCS